MELPTTSLPWALPVLPLNNTQPFAPRDGERVFGFFADGEAGQHPIILGVFPNIPVGTPDSNTAFSDARSPETLKDHPRPPKSKTFNNDGSGVVIEEQESAKLYPFNLDEPSTPRLARNDTDFESDTIKERKSNLIEVNTVSGTWKEPETQYKAKYPFNRAYESESGHSFEVDDTPGGERITMTHRAGSFVEYFPDGSVVGKVVKDNYTIILGSDRVCIMGKCQVTIKGDSEVLINGNADIKVDGDFNMDINGKCDINSGGNMKLTAPRIDLN
jgi:hypothetical protein